MERSKYFMTSLLFICFGQRGNTFAFNRPFYFETNWSNITTTYKKINLISAIENTTNNGLHLDVCSPTYDLRPLIERQCDQLTCTYGKCTREIEEFGEAYNCECDTGADGNLCEYKCCLQCGEYGMCVLNSETEICNCIDLRYTGEYCNLTKTKAHYVLDRSTQYVKETWYLWVVGACVVVLVILLVTLVIFPYILWKKRISFMMKVVYYFQPFEDNDEKEWDAFVSYKSGDFDEAFVTRKLRPRLEDEIGFKLCLHFRDFLPGESIASNILRAINGSRRTILLLSPRYVGSEWTQFEYQIAQELTIRRKHRIIPVIISDITPVMSIMDQNLRHIIKSITYLEWPGDDDNKKEDIFWDKIRFSLPKCKYVVNSKRRKPDNEQRTEGNVDYVQLDNRL